MDILILYIYLDIVIYIYNYHVHCFVLYVFFLVLLPPTARHWYFYLRLHRSQRRPRDPRASGWAEIGGHGEGWTNIYIYIYVYIETTILNCI